jgi:hypothetical protein
VGAADRVAGVSTFTFTSGARGSAPAAAALNACNIGCVAFEVD